MQRAPILIKLGKRIQRSYVVPIVPRASSGYNDSTVVTVITFIVRIYTFTSDFCRGTAETSRQTLDEGPTV